jgi:hypothetical protein
LIVVLVGGVATASEERGHEVAVFVGVTDDRGEYAYLFTERMAVGAFFDKAEGDLRATVLGGLFYFHPTRRVVLVVGPGVEWLDPPASDGAHGSEHAESETEFLIRVGALYDFPLSKRVALLPAIYADFVNSEVIWVGGIELVYRF